MIREVSINERGYTLAGALALLAVMAILMAISLPLWTRLKQREMEEEMIFRGNEYVEAIARYHQKFGSYPPDLDTLHKLKFIRKLYPDPMTKTGKWKELHPDALLQTGAAGAINQPGLKNVEDDKDDKEGKKDSFDRDDEKDPQDITPGLSNDEDEESDEEDEVENAGPIVGVASRSKKASIKIYNGQAYYNKWVFVYALPAQQQQQQPRPGGGQQDPKDNKSKSKDPKNPVKNPPPVDEEKDDDGDWEKE